MNAIPFCVRTDRAHPRSSNSSPTRDAPPSFPFTRAMRSGRPYVARVATARALLARLIAPAVALARIASAPSRAPRVAPADARDIIATTPSSVVTSRRRSAKKY
jgi:hypothetical protein